MFHQQILNQASWLAEEQQLFCGYQSQLAVLRTKFSQAQADGTLPILTLPSRCDDLETIDEIAKQIRSSSDGLIVLGTGGSSLGGQTLCALAEKPFPVHFIDNVDPHSIEAQLNHYDLMRQHVLIVSKSGGTLETLVQAALFLGKMAESVPQAEIYSRAHLITMPGESPLRTLAEHYDIPVIEHDPKVGGRYSVLSNVGLLPAAVAGVDITALRAGAKRVMDEVLQSDEAAALQGAAWQAALMKTRPVSVIMPYCDRLRLLGSWYKQLWAESLGKSGLGSTPQDALGAVDQHSQLQLYLDGPKDKSLTLITLPHQHSGPKIPPLPMDGQDYLKGQTVGDIMAAMQHGTIETLKQNGLPLRLLELDALNAETLGALLMHYMIETIAAAWLLGINAFDQPAVEDSKRIARDTLRGGAPSRTYSPV